MLTKAEILLFHMLHISHALGAFYTTWPGKWFRLFYTGQIQTNTTTPFTSEARLGWHCM